MYERNTIKMLSILCIILVMTSLANAKVMTSLVNANELDATELEGFQSTVYGSIMAHLDAEYQILQPIIEQQNQSMNNCKGLITAAEQTCKTCASRRCQQDFGGLVLAGFGKMTGWFEGTGKRSLNIVDWEGWQKIGGFFRAFGVFGLTGSSFDNMKNFFGNIGSAFSSGFNVIKNTFSNVGSAIGSGFKSLFGRRRRDVGRVAPMTARRLKMIRHRYMAKRVEELDPEVRQCMEQCNECTPFLGDQTAMIGGVCGDQILLDQASMAEVMTNIEALFHVNGNPVQGTLPILTKVEFDQSDFSWSDFSVGGVYVTAMTPEGEIRYPSNFRYKMQSPQTTAAEIAQELIDKWNV